MSTEFHVDGFGCGNVAVRCPDPAPLNGVRPLNRNSCGSESL